MTLDCPRLLSHLCRRCPENRKGIFIDTQSRSPCHTAARCVLFVTSPREATWSFDVSPWSSLYVTLEFLSAAASLGLRSAWMQASWAPILTNLIQSTQELRIPVLHPLPPPHPLLIYPPWTPIKSSFNLGLVLSKDPEWIRQSPC